MFNRVFNRMILKAIGPSLILSICFSHCFAASLDEKLDSLNIPDDKVTDLLSEENLISVTGRYSSLRKRHELTIKGAHNFMADSHLQTRQVGASYRYHINSRFSLGASYTEYENKLTSAGKRLFDEQRLLPDSDFAVKSADGFINFNTVYGKFRLTSKQVVYFDHYIALGYGHIDLVAGETQSYNLDTGLSFWIGKHASFRLGVKNEFYRQRKINESKNVQNSMGYIELGYLL